MRKIKDHSLYLVISEEYGNGRSAEEIAKCAITGGIDLIQMREKHKTRAELIRLGRKLSRMCKDSGVIFIVNDDPSIAKAVDADGVHLGQEDAIRYPVEETREAIGTDRIIGISTHSVEQFEDANKKDFDYIAFGPIFETRTKDYFLGTKDIRDVAGLAKKPVFFIGGINLSNIEDILRRGAKNIALIRGITGAKDIISAIGELKKYIITMTKEGRRKI